MTYRSTRMLERLLARLHKERDRESLLADFDEIYQDICEERGKASADAWYLKQVLSSIPPALSNKLYWFSLMFKNYCVLAFRKYTRQRVMTLVNLSGLAIGLAAFILIRLYVGYETSFDTFHENSRNIYRLQHNTYIDGELRSASAMTSAAFPTALKDNFGEVEDYALATRSFLEYASFAYTDEISFRADRIFLVTPSFLRMFDFPLLRGDPETQLTGPLEAVVTQAIARQTFGDEDPIGKTIVYNKKHPFTVTGVCAEPPANSHFKFDVLLSFPSLPYATPRISRAFEAPETDWDSGSFYAYVALRPDADPESLVPKLNAWFEDSQGERWRKAGRRHEILLQPLESIHLNSDLAHELEPESQGSAQAVQVLGMIAVFIVILAWVNYINLSTARALERAKEVGIRKVAGAYRKQLVKQFLFEYLGLNVMAIVMALILVFTFVPYISRMTQTDLSLRFLLGSESLPTLLWTILGGSFLAGLYPAVMLSAFRPVNVIRGRLTRRVGGVRVRKFLVAGQLAVSVALIAGTLVVFQQITFLMNRDQGFAVAHSLVVHAPGTNEPPPEVFVKNFEAFRKSVMDTPDVLGMSTTTAVPGEEILWGSGFRRLEDDSSVTHGITLVGIDQGFIPAFGIKILAGRNFSLEFPNDGESVILNEAAARVLDYRSPEEAVNRTIVWRGREMPVVGVIQNYNQLSPKMYPIPLAYLYSPNRGFVTFDLSPENTAQTTSRLKRQWQRFFPGIPFDYFFMDDFFNRHYANDQKFGRVFVLFSALTILIACLGLFALASHNAVQRTKEIGIRKAVGASVRDIYVLLSKEFLRLAAVAGVVAIPLTYIQMQRWLENYAFRIQLEWWFFAAAWVLVAVVVLATISYQSLRAALAHPVQALRYE
jgi:putative ABC transport system permease protein